MTAVTTRYDSRRARMVRGALIGAAVGAVVALCVVAVACGTDESPSDTSSATTAAATTTLTPNGTLSPMLLTGADIFGALPGGAEWRVQAITGSEGLGGFTRMRCEAMTLDPAVLQRLVADAGVDGSRADGNASLVEFLIVDDPSQLAADLTAYRSADEACSSMMSTGPGMAGSTRTLNLPTLGDQQWAQAGICRGWGTDSRGYSAVVRVGDTAVGLSTCEQPVKTGDELSISDEAFVLLLQRAVQKVTG